MKNRHAVWPLLVIAAYCASGWAEQNNTHRNPFRPGTTADAPAAPAPVKGMVGDAEHWHFWTTDAQGRWRRREPPKANEQPSSAVKTADGQRNGSPLSFRR